MSGRRDTAADTQKSVVASNTEWQFSERPVKKVSPKPGASEKAAHTRTQVFACLHICKSKPVAGGGITLY